MTIRLCLLSLLCLATKLAIVSALIPDVGEINPNLTESDFSNGIMPVVQWLINGSGIPAASSFEAVSSAEPMDAFATLVGPFRTCARCSGKRLVQLFQTEIDANIMSDACMVPCRLLQLSCNGTKFFWRQSGSPDLPPRSLRERWLFSTRVFTTHGQHTTARQSGSTGRRI